MEWDEVVAEYPERHPVSHHLHKSLRIQSKSLEMIRSMSERYWWIIMEAQRQGRRRPALPIALGRLVHKPVTTPLRPVNHKTLARRWVGTDVHLLARSRAKVHKLLVARPERMGDALAGREGKEIPILSLLLPGLCLTIRKDDKGCARLARIENVYPLVLVAVPVQDGALGVRLDAAEVYAELREPAGIAEGERVPDTFGIHRMRDLAE